MHDNGKRGERAREEEVLCRNEGGDERLWIISRCGVVLIRVFGMLD